MARSDHGEIAFKRLSDVDPGAIIELVNDPAVRRHLPLARGRFGPSECESFVAAKERIWEENGYGPWAFVIGDEFIGWGGLQPEGKLASRAAWILASRGSQTVTEEALVFEHHFPVSVEAQTLHPCNALPARRKQGDH